MKRHKKDIRNDVLHQVISSGWATSFLTLRAGLICVKIFKNCYSSSFECISPYFASFRGLILNGYSQGTTARRVLFNFCVSASL